MAEHHEHGSMDTTDHERTFATFVTIVGRAIVVILLALVFLALVNG